MICDRGAPCQDDLLSEPDHAFTPRPRRPKGSTASALASPAARGRDRSVESICADVEAHLQQFAVCALKRRAVADFIVIVCPLNADTLKLIDARRLGLMKPTAFLVNVGRGPIVDEAALIDVLRAGRIAGAGLDVFEQEPTAPDNPLLSMESVIVTPHALCWTDECFHEIAVSGLNSVVDVSLGLRPQHVVNPEVYNTAKS